MKPALRADLFRLLRAEWALQRTIAEGRDEAPARRYYETRRAYARRLSFRKREAARLARGLRRTLAEGSLDEAETMAAFWVDEFARVTAHLTRRELEALRIWADGKMVPRNELEHAAAELRAWRRRLHRLAGV